jgi:hypothetical protein
MKRIIFLLFAIAGLACSSQQNQPVNYPKPTKDPTVYKGVTDNECAIEVQFGSYSAGIDGKLYEKIISFIDSNKVKYTATNIGREGETRLCLPLTELKSKKKQQFIARMKKLVKEGFLCSVSIR